METCLCGALKMESYRKNILDLYFGFGGLIMVVSEKVKKVEKVEEGIGYEGIGYLDDYTVKINDVVSKLKNDFIYVGFLLWEVREYKLYKVKGYKSIVDYAEKELNFKKAATYNFIGVCEKFSERTESGNPSARLDPQFEKFNFTQLVEVLPLEKKKVKSINPEMTVTEIREVKKEIKESKKDKKVKKVEVILDDPSAKEEKIIEVEEIVKVEECFLDDFQIRLLDFFVNKYVFCFNSDWQEKFNKSKKLEKLFGKNEVNICEEMGKINDILLSKMGD